MHNIGKNINSLSSPDPVPRIYILPARNHCCAAVYANYVHILHCGALFFCGTLYDRPLVVLKVPLNTSQPTSRSCQQQTVSEGLFTVDSVTMFSIVATLLKQLQLW